MAIRETRVTITIIHGVMEDVTTSSITVPTTHKHARLKCISTRPYCLGPKKVLYFWFH